MRSNRAVLLCAFGSSDIKGIEESIGILKKDIEVHFNFRIKVEIAFTSKIIVSIITATSIMFLRFHIHFRIFTIFSSFILCFIEIFVNIYCYYSFL